MSLLAIETTGAKASAALLSESGELRIETSDETMNHLQHLIPMIDSLLSKCGITIDDVSVIAISEGPGSFTGIRIGMATAKGLAQVIGAPVVGVPTLESFVYHRADYRGLVCPIFDAKRSQVYAGVYFCDGRGGYRRLMEDGAYDLPVYLEGLRTACSSALAERGGLPEEGPLTVTLFGDGIAPYGEQIAKAVEDWNFNSDSLSTKGDICLKTAEEEQRYQSAASVAMLGRSLFDQGKAKSLFDLHPVYLRKAEAERKLEEAQKKK
ncbi:tRNA (adenosine(37)-N6)-threonylcarbamoyltransferase complex dimerization subunit type 1 TsaB [Bacilliculturomica massiliensis]|uniref:tRNA (adenosine(37)-N6)-threonylcarbamoyltransferase complex dimerization subunit type 1 TsaB n=1 Tax=Bacilliculturomica massiliensis TaxID=1917867 RepID=UPI0013EF01B9|nr:tRNA (adenosine(37)-N6)-threonylcarbamoyltransferase complex dimerization subunit type 1 TsaB [Bacilliculturomica massiliensis]